MIEDNPLDAELVQRMLFHAKGGRFVLQRVETVATGVEAVARNGVDLVLCDLSLPDCGGLDTFVRIHEHAPRVPIIVLSGTSDEDVAVNAVGLGAQDYLVKQQIEPDLLVRSIRYALERKRIELSLQDERDLIQTLLDNVPARIYFKDEQSQFQRVNRGWLRLFALSDSSEVLGKTDFDFFTEEHAGQAREDEKRVMRTGEPILNLVEKETYRDRPHTWALTSKFPRRDKAGQIIGTFGISSDITPLKQAEEKLTQANAELRETYEQLKAAQLDLIQAEKLQSIGRLAASVFHEVKNPLATLQMCVDYISNMLDLSDPRLREVLRDMNDAVGRADQIITTGLDFSGNHNLQKKKEDLHQVIERAIRLLAHELGKHPITLIKEFEGGIPPVLVDAAKLVQVLVNVMTNAIHAMDGEDGESVLCVQTRLRRIRTGDIPRDEGSRQATQLRAGEDAVAIELLDTGAGIPADKLDKVFDPFFTTKPTGKGTGLGLTVTKKIIEMHSGHIQIENRKPKGTRVVITLPL